MNYKLLFTLIIFCSFLFTGNLSAEHGFPAVEPSHSGMLQVDTIHSIYWEECGNPNGIPVIFLHGGPGSGIEEKHRTYFNPREYRIILFDQRGSGKSCPAGCLEQNTTWDLVEDINELRRVLKIEQCVLFGGSWGSTLALTYAIKYPENVLALILRGIFLCEQQELDWFYKDGANQLMPKAWNIFLNQIPFEKQGDLIAAYHEQLHSESAWTRYKAAASWMIWEFANMHAQPDPRLEPLLDSSLLYYFFAFVYSPLFNYQMASIENHYFFNNCFFQRDCWILENVHRIKDIPGIIIQGEKDQICPKENAFKLHLAWPRSTINLIPEAGHAADEPGIEKALIDATEYFQQYLQHRCFYMGL